MKRSSTRSRRLVLPFAFLFSVAFAAVSLAFAPEVMEWAYPPIRPADPKSLNTTIKRHVPGSARSYTEAQVDDPYSPPDWFPNEHPVMPGVVAHGVKPAIVACSRCHLANGAGHPESASLAGQSQAYLQQQMVEFKAGRRTGSKASDVMTRFARAISDADARAAANYFAALKPIVFDQVVESKTVSKSHVAFNAVRLVDPHGGREPLGQRIITLAQDQERALSRDPHSGFVDYVPVGSIARGRALVTSGGGGRTMPCAGCHGDTLQGQGGPGPAIAGRPPLYLVRQLNDFQRGARTGAGSEMMGPVVKNLTQADMIAIAAYVGSRRP